MANRDGMLFNFFEKWKEKRLNKFAKNQMGKLGSMWKGAKAWGAKQASKLGNIVELAKNPKKLAELMKGKLTK